MAFYAPETWKRFEALVAYIPFHSCYEFVGYRKAGGYGWFNLGADVGSEFAHRVAYRQYNGPIPFGLDVMHKCDNPPCVREEHLVVGTRRRNMLDMYGRGLRAGGGLVSVLDNEQDRIEFLALWDSQEYTQKELAKLYGVKRATVSRYLIALGRRQRKRVRGLRGEL